MPYTFEELKKNEFWLKLHEQDRVDYQKKLEQAETFRDTSEIVDDEGNVVQINKTTPMRNSVDKKSPMYHGGEIRDKVLDREIKELI
jgi:hypothetical protein